MSLFSKQEKVNTSSKLIPSGSFSSESGSSKSPKSILVQPKISRNRFEPLINEPGIKAKKIIKRRTERQKQI